MKLQKILSLLFVLTVISFPVIAQKTVSTINRDNQTSAIAGTILAKDSNKTETFNFSDIHMCFDQYPNVNIPQKPLYKPPVLPPRLNQNGELYYPNTTEQALSNVPTLCWNPGDILTVGFYRNEGTDIVINKVKKYAKEWETVANIKFLFVDDVNNALIKCGFVKGHGSWSWIGRTAIGNILKERTMNFGWFDDNTPDVDVRRTVLHEFGHVLGFIHEHLSPLANRIPWIKPKVYAYFAGPPNNWTREQVDQYIFYKYSNSYVNSTSYDKTSIMHYFFPSSLTSDGSSFSQNDNLSTMDKIYAAYIYPFPPKITGSSGTLHTGDDCDAIDFKLEFFPGLDSNFIEFIFQPGVDPWNEKVTWWKQIGIPMKGGIEAPIQLRPDGRSELVRLPVNNIDFTRQISFSKAKILGLHTLLPFKWNALSAMKGGCRLTLTWKQDRCQKIF